MHQSLVEFTPHTFVQTEADDPLDAFMAEMQQMVDEQEAQPSKAGRAELEEEEDHVADFLEARTVCDVPLKSLEDVAHYCTGLVCIMDAAAAFQIWLSRYVFPMKQ